MIRALTFLLLIPLNLTLLIAQPVIDSTDMPVPGETLKRTIIIDPENLDYLSSGASHTWNFSAIDGNEQTADTFVTVNSTNLAYAAVFNNPLDPEHRATVASPQPPLGSMPGVTIEKMYMFFKRTSSFYGQVGYGAEINEVPVPVRFDDADILYRFPLEYGNIDTSESFYDINIPSLGYNSESRFRINTVDGWGTIYLPADTFEVMRVKTVAQIRDSIYIDSLGFGFGFNRTETEYKWLAEGQHVPVFHIIVRSGGMGGGSTSVDGWFFDSRDHTGIQNHLSIDDINISPNPADGTLRISNPEGSLVNYRIFSISGQELMSGSFTGSGHEIITESLKPATYLICLQNEQSILTRIFSVSR